MDLFEYQARDLFAKHGVPVLAGEVIDTPEAAREVTERLGGRSVVKAQVKVGGRGKAGGVKLASSPDEAVARATDILGMDIKGHTVHKVMIAETAPEIAEEYYVSYLLDRTNRTFLAMASVQGGVEIEVVAEENPEALAKIPVNANEGVDLEKAREIVAAAKFPAEVADQVADIMVTLWKTFIDEDALLVEVNPLAKVADGRVIALDGKVSSTRTPTSASRSTRRWRTRTRPTRSRPLPRPRTSTTSSSTARSASSATARVWSCRPSTSSRTPVRTTAA